ncbi:DUF1366 domain-containing protein [Streptococcus agalactiae]|uniref:DUF1366 domain-containing protein n=1 Tax=Streptococcus agalactiae TaxID=1311 RepID=UPI00085CA455|nr:DUF1366 domain-containing protein [Streptococcus agalactiae]
MTTDLSVYELVSKFPTTALDGSITACNIRLRTSDWWEFPIVLPADFYDKSHAEIITECNDIIYQRLFPSRAEDEKFKELTDQIELSKAQQAKTELMLKAMSETLNAIIAQSLPSGVTTDETTEII